MSFLAPLFLLGALAIAGPVIFHLIRRTTRERTRFGSLMFLDPSPPRLTRKSRVEHWLLLILRCVALALLALAFARPFLQETSPQAAVAGLPARTVVLLDASASLRRGDLWADALERVRSAADEASPSDQLAIVTFGRSTAVRLNFDDWNAAAPSARRALVDERLAGLTPSWESTELGGAIATAAEMLLDQETATAGPRRILLVSDLQAGSRTDALASFEWPAGVQVLLATVSAGNRTNASLQLVAEAADADRSAEPIVRVRVTNAAESTREQFTVGWDEDGSGRPAPGALEVYVPPGQSRVLSLPVGDLSRPRTAIALSGDDEAFDNRVFINPPERRRVEVLYLGAENPTDARQPLYFLRRALTGTPRIDLTVAARGPSEPWTTENAAAGVIFVSDPLPAEGATALRSRIESGATVVAAPKAASFGPTLGALLGSAPVALAEVRPPSYAMFGEIDFRHPVFAPFADPRYSDFTKIQIWAYRRVPLETLPTHRVLARFDSGDPALVEISLGRGRLLVLATGWMPTDSQLGVSSKFVPLLYSILELGGALPTTFVPYVVGDRLPLPSVAGAQLIGPEGINQAIGPEQPTVVATVPGRYRIEAAGVDVAAYAVNVDAAESRLQPLGPDELEPLGLPLAPPESVQAAAEAREILLRGVETEGRQKLWRWFVIGALLVLFIESALAGRTARRNALQRAATSP